MSEAFHLPHTGCNHPQLIFMSVGSLYSVPVSLYPYRYSWFATFWDILVILHHPEVAVFRTAAQPFCAFRLKHLASGLGYFNLSCLFCPRCRLGIITNVRSDVHSERERISLANSVNRSYPPFYIPYSFLPLSCYLSSLRFLGSISMSS